jgi:hypothetical protein
LGLLAARRSAAQDLGHKTLGTLGLRAGAQPETGIYVIGRFVSYTADEAFDRNGHRLPGEFDLDVTAGGIGFSGAYRIAPIATYVNASFGAPLVRVTGGSDRAEGSIDRFGLADIYMQPLKLGWRLSHLDLVTGYAFYIPTGRFSPGRRGGVSRAQWSHEFSLGGTVYFDSDRTWQLSALASYELNQQKIGIDITRGDTIQIQGGVGKTLYQIVDVGLVGYGLWQVRDDRGSQLPPVLAGARDRVYGVGAELDVAMPTIRGRATLRYTHDLSSQARPEGQLLLFGLSFAAWQAKK